MSVPSAAEGWQEQPAIPAETVERDREDGEGERETFELPLWEPSTRERIREAWESRHLLPGLARTSIPTHRGAILGRAWLVLRPFMQVFGFAVIFGGIFGVKPPNGVPYLLFLVLGMQAFRLFDITLIYATVSTRLVKGVVRGLRFPLLLIPLSTIGRSLVRLGIYWIFAAVLLVYYLVARGHFYLQVDPRLLVGIAGTALCLAFGIALGLTTSVIYPRARDMRYFVRYGSQLWALFTPVFYPIEALPDGYQTVALINPLTGFVGMVQYGFLGAGELHLYGIAWSLVSLVLIALFGLWFFNRFATRWIGAFKRDEEEEGIDEEGVL